MRKTFAAALSIGVCLAAWSTPAMAQTREFRIPAGSLKQALDTYARQSGRQVIYKADEVRGSQSRGVEGALSAEAALAALLSNTGYAARIDSSGALAIVKSGNGGIDSDENYSPDTLNGEGDSANPAGEIIVTATRSRQRLSEVPSSVTAESAEQLRRRGATALQDIIATTPGLSNPSPGGSNNTNLVIRGVTTDTTAELKQSTVSVLFDDIPVDPATASLLTTNLRIVDIERVEVLRGPQGTLFGSGSLSGAIRYVTNKPDASRYAGSAEATVANTRTGANSYAGNVVLNVPIVADRVAIRAVGYGFDEGGWIDNLATNEKDSNRNKTYGGRVALSAQATDDFLITLTGAYQKSHDYGQNDSLFAQPAIYDGQVTTNRRFLDSYAETTLANLGLRYDFGGVSLFSSSTYMRRKAETQSNFFFFSNLLGLPPGSDFTPTATFNNANIFQQEVRLASAEGRPFRWTLGGFYLWADTPDGGQTVRSPGAVPIVGTDQLITFEVPGTQKELAGFGEATYSIGDMLDITGGLRIARTTIDVSSIASGIFITGSTNPLPPFRQLRRETTVNPRFSVIYHPSREVSLYAQAARGYRVGGANNTAVLGGPGIPATYGSDSLWNYEAGIKTNLLDGKLQINADVYYIDWKDLQVSLNQGGFGYTGNASAARVYGFEAEAAAKPAPWLDLGASMSLSNSALTEDAPTLLRVTGIIGAHDGDRLPGSPRTTASAYAQLNFRHRDDVAFIRASGNYVGSAYTDFASQGIRYGDYAAMNLRAGVVHDNIEVTIFANNLLNSDGKLAALEASVVSGIPAAPRYAYRLRPRTIGLTGRIAF